MYMVATNSGCLTNNNYDDSEIGGCVLLLNVINIMMLLIKKK